MIASLRPIPLKSVVADATAVALSYVPLGVLYGALAERAGLTLLEAAGMSLMIYSGAAQLVAAQMLAAGASPFSIVLASAVLTIRHVLMGASLSKFTRPLFRRRQVDLEPLDDRRKFRPRMEPLP